MAAAWLVYASCDRPVSLERSSRPSAWNDAPGATYIRDRQNCREATTFLGLHGIATCSVVGTERTALIGAASRGFEHWHRPGDGACCPEGCAIPLKASDPSFRRVKHPRLPVRMAEYRRLRDPASGGQLSFPFDLPSATKRRPFQTNDRTPESSKTSMPAIPPSLVSSISRA